MNRRAALRDLAACATLALLALAALSPVLDAGFLTYDDDQYVTRNPHVQQGLTRASLGWAWTATWAANWHPLTWMSHMLDWRLFGAAPWGHHLTSLLLHAASAILLYVALRAATGDRAPAFLTAALFAVHPLHVESVAWIAERKDVLGGLFWMLTLIAYVGYARRPGRARYAAVVALFALGLCAKPMLVTLPVVLLILDRWPLRRDASPARLIAEKVPLLVLAAASSAVTLAAQRAGGTMPGSEVYPLPLRVANALVAYVAYLGRAVWPVRLAVFYPHPRGALSAAELAGAAALLLAITLVAVRLRARCPHLLAGWLWYLATLVPVIGLVQVGSQARADRYTYLPLVGIFIAAAWTLAPLARSTGGRLAVGIPAVALVALLAAASRVQAGYWRDTATLFTHALAVTPDNAIARQNLGIALAASGRLDEGIAELYAATRLAPDYARAHENLARLLAAAGRYREAWDEVRASRRLGLDPDPDFVERLAAAAPGP